jgi:hypothetical protein
VLVAPTARQMDRRSPGGWPTIGRGPSEHCPWGVASVRHSLRPLLCLQVAPWCDMRGRSRSLAQAGQPAPRWELIRACEDCGPQSHERSAILRKLFSDRERMCSDDSHVRCS